YNPVADDIYHLSLHDALPIWGAIWTSKKSLEIRGAMRIFIFLLVSIAQITISNRWERMAWKAARATMRISRAGVCRDERGFTVRSEEHTSELQSRFDLVCRLL